MKAAKRPVDGWLILDKSLGISSAKAVAKAKYLIKPMKIGHAGTLDPLASGILPLALGEATKTIQYVMEASKTYRFTITWGQERSTDDAEGEVVAESALRPSEGQIWGIMPMFLGEVEQIPPIYSAIKVDGQRAYALARAGAEVELQSRKVIIENISLISIQHEVSATFEVTCGKGTYIRSIGRDMGRKLGCYGYISELRRTRVGKYCENHAISLDLLEQLVHSAPPNKYVHSVESALDDILAFEVDCAGAARLRQGQAVPSTLSSTQPVWAREQGGRLVALGTVEAFWFKPARVFNLS